MPAKVILKHGYAPDAMAYDALKGIFKDNAQGKKILLKPNAGRIGVKGGAICTNAEVIRGLIKFFQEQEAAEILVGDGPLWGVNIWDALKESGIQDVCEEMGATCVDLDSYKPLVLEVSRPTVIAKLKFSSIIKEVDFIISVPVMKTHMYTGATLSIKNMKGCLYKMEKTKLHRIESRPPDSKKGRTLDYGIADMATLLLPDYAVIDATICMEGFGPSAGTPLNMDLVLASADPTAADYTAVQLMGLEWNAVSHINLTQEFCATASVNEIEIDPPDFKKYAKTFKLASMQELKNVYPNISVKEHGSCSACSAALMIFLKTHGHKFPKDLQFTLASGKNLTSEEIADQQTYLIGNCAADALPGQPYCKGCPPVGSSILAFINNEELTE